MRWLANLPRIIKAYWPCWVCLIAYLYVFPYFPRINNPNENVRLYMTAAIVEYGSYQIDPLRQRWGWVNDAAVSDGHAYSVKAPGTSLLGIPGYSAYLAFTRMFGLAFDRTVALWCVRCSASIAPWLLFLVFFWRWLQKQPWSPKIQQSVFWSVSIASCLYGYGMLFMSHTLSAAAAFGAFMLLSEARTEPRGLKTWPWLVAGFLSAATTWLEYPGLIASVILSLWACWIARRRPKALVFFALGAVPLTLSMMHFQWVAFGKPWMPGHLMVENDAFRAAHHQGFYGATGLNWAALGLWFDRGYGLFPLTPFLWLAWWGWLTRYKNTQKSDKAVSFLVFLLTSIAIFSMNNWRGGWTLGPRYLALCIPFVAYAAAWGWHDIIARWPMADALLTGAVVTGIMVSGALSAYYPHIPPEFESVVGQFFWPLLQQGYVPSNLGAAAGVPSMLSMLPIWMLLASIAVTLFKSRAWGVRHYAIALISMLVLTAPLCIPTQHSPAQQQMLDLVMNRWR